MSDSLKKINRDLTLTLSEHFKEVPYQIHKILTHCTLFSICILSLQKFIPKTTLITPVLYIIGLMTILRIMQLFNVKKSDLSKFSNVLICLYMLSLTILPVLAQKILFTIIIITSLSFWSDLSLPFILHSILPNKAQRKKQARAINNNDRNPARPIRTKFEIPNYISNLHLFSEKYFKKTDKTLIRFLGERLGKKETSQIALQTWSLMIPKNISTDAVKIILGVNRVDEFILGTYSELYKLKIEDNQPLVDDLFILYNESQIKRIFTTNFSVLDYKIILITKLKYPDFILPIESKFKDTINYMHHFVDNKNGLGNLPISESDKPLLKVQEVFDSIYRFIPITTTLELYNWGTALDNCLHSYTKNFFTEHSIFLIGIKKNNEEWACMQINNGQVVQMKKSKNIDLNPYEVQELQKLLKPFNLDF